MYRLGRGVICVSKKIIFIAGSYGVGKTTICNQLSKSLKIKAYSASDLISKQNNEQYGKINMLKIVMIIKEYWLMKYLK